MTPASRWLPRDSAQVIFGAVGMAESGQAERAREWVELALQMRDNEPHYLYNAACVHAVLGDTDRAIERLERAVALGWGDRAWIENDSDLAVLRSDPRFAALLEPHYLYTAACAHAGLGDSDRAIDLLGRAVELGWGDRTWIENDSELAILRPDPRFAALLDRMA